jgi:ATP synthase protein I
MSESGRRPDSNDRSGADLAWSIVSYEIAGIVLYGGIGWGLDHWLGTSFLAPIGVIVGLVAGLYLSFVRINRS